MIPAAIMRTCFLKYYTWLICCCCFFEVAAQDQFRFRHLGYEEGFPQSTVTCILQDKDGFLWFGCQDGLIRYDGYNYITYRHESEKPGSLGNNYINDLKEDPNGKYLWIAGRGGVSRFEKSTGIFDNYNPRGSDFYMVYSICIDQNGRLWAGALDSSFSVKLSEWSNRNSKAVTIMHQKDGKEILGNNIFSITEAPNGFLLFVTENQVWAKDKSDRFDCIWKANRTKAKDSSHFDLLFSSPKKGICNMINFGGSLNDTFLKKSGIKIRNISEMFPNLPWCHFITEDQKGHLWIGGGKGLWYISSLVKGIEPVLISHNSANKESISSDVAQCVFEDRSGLIWIGTSYGGLNIYNPNTKVFKHISDNKSEKWHLNNRYIFGLAEDEAGNIWAGTMNGLNCLRFRNETYGNYFDNISSVDLYLHDPNNNHSLSENKTGALYYAGNDSLFVSTVGGGLNILNIKTGIFNSYQADPKHPEGLTNNYLQSVRPDHHHQTWISQVGGPRLWNPAKQNIEMPDVPWPKPEEKYRRVMEVFEDSRGITWFAEDQGLVNFDRKNHKTRLFLHDDKDKNSLSSNTIGIVFEDHLKRLWIGTLGGGLDLYNPGTNTFTSFTEKDGLSNNHIFGILEDHSGNLWLSTNKGISMFNPDTRQFRNYGQNEGLAFSEFAQHSFLKAHNGWMFFGGEDGIIGFNPDEVMKTAYEAPVRLLDLKINYKSVGEGLNGILLSEITQLILNYDQKVVSFEFGTLNYSNPANCKYAYKLEGFDNEWHYTDSKQRFATYTNLPFGEYSFIVKATDEFGTWMDHSLKIPLKVVPPFWLTWWFISLLSIILLLTIIYIVSFFSRLRLQRQLQKLEIANSLQSERERISRELHDNVGSQLTYIISRIDNTTRKAEFIQFANEVKTNLENIGLFARSTMQQLRESIWAMNKDSFSLEEFETKLRDYMSKYIDAESGMTWNITLNQKRKAVLSPAIVINLFRIIQEAVQNCIKHSKANSINIYLKTNKNELIVTIKDNGTGIVIKENLQTEAHYGLQNMQKRASEMNGQIAIDSREGLGTTINFIMPLE
jgi:signal transduction histidine kinase/ligand-binding sensor domain-containing protein